MYISARADYALRALITLAAEGRPMTADELARSQDLPARYLNNALLALRNAGFVATRNGRGNGWRFVRPPSELTASDVITALDGPLTNINGVAPENAAYEGHASSLQDLWLALRASMRNVLEAVTVEHLANGQLPTSVVELVASPNAWRPI
jgi:Rrf2 family protein